MYYDYATAAGRVIQERVKHLMPIFIVIISLGKGPEKVTMAPDSLFFQSIINIMLILTLFCIITTSMYLTYSQSQIWIV